MQTFKNVSLFLAVLLMVFGFSTTSVFAKAPAKAAYNVQITDVLTMGATSTLSGFVEAVNYAGSFNSYGIVVSWGDNTSTVYSSLSALGFVNTGTVFYGTYQFSHIYQYPGAYPVQVKLYKNSPSSSPLASTTTVVWPTF